MFSVAAWAQETTTAPPGDTPKSKVTFDVAGGATFPTGPAAPRFNPGWNLMVGGGANLSQAFAVRGEYFMSSLGASGTLFNSTGLDGRQWVHTFGLAGMFSVGKNRGVSAYVIGGPAAVFRRISVTQYAGTTIAPYCDPYFFYCYAAPVSVSNVLGTRSEWDFGLSGGLGVQYGFGRGDTHVFLEARYEYVFGQTYRGVNQEVNSSVGFVPVFLGFRW